MCGRYTSTTSIDTLAHAYAVDEVRADPLPVRYNVAPTQPVYAIAVRRPREPDGRPRRQLGTFAWGLVPSWAKDRSVGARMINARAETIAEKPAYRTALVRRRCLIPADAFYEWQERPPAPDGHKRSRLPYAVRRTDGRTMAFAGLWEVWRDPNDPDGERLRTAVIITTAANDMLVTIHERMPAILPPEAWDTWLDPTYADVDALRALLVPAPADGIEAFPVSTKVNKVALDGPELLDPIPAPPD